MRLATPHEKRLIICLAIIHGFNSVFINAFPFWFKNPSMSSSFCSSIPSSEDFKSFPDYFHSIPIEYKLYCSELVIKSAIVSILLFGIFLAILIGMILRISPHQRNNLIFLTNFIAAFCMICSAFSTSLPFIVFFLAIAVAMSSLYYTNVYTFVAERFENRPFKNLLPAILTTTFGMFGMGFAGWVWSVREWRSLNLWFGGIPLITASTIFYWLERVREQNEKTLEVTIFIHLYKN